MQRGIINGLWMGLAIVAALFAGQLVYSHIAPPQISANRTFTPKWQGIDHLGKPITPETVHSKPAIVQFGFTHCPDVCPTSLADMQLWFHRLGEDADKFNYIFFSVDPQRDTPELLKSYMEAFEQPVIGITGAGSYLKEMQMSYGVTAIRSDDGDNYTINHTAGTYVVDRNKVLRATIAYQEDVDNAMLKLRRVLAGS